MVHQAEVPPVAKPPRRVSGRGLAFSIEDALLAMRWGDLMKPVGYRLTISHAFRHADEVVVVEIPPFKTPLAKIYRCHHLVWLTDCSGLKRHYATLADALRSIAPLSRHEARMVSKAVTPRWLPVIQTPINVAPVQKWRLARWTKAAKRSCTLSILAFQTMLACGHTVGFVWFQRPPDPVVRSSSPPFSTTRRSTEAA